MTASTATEAEAEAQAAIAAQYMALPKARSMRSTCPKCGGAILMRRFAVVTMREDVLATSFVDARTGTPVALRSETREVEVLRVICGTCRYEIGRERPNDAKVPCDGQ